jgi:hypothetical protein
MLKKIRAWLDRRTKGSTDPGKIDSARQDAMAGLGANLPPNYVPPVDEGRPRH